MRHLHFESLETRRLLTGTPEMLHRGAICSVTESRTAGVAFITDAGTLDACGSNASPQVLRRTDGTAEGSYRLGPSRTDNHIKPETIVEAGESVYFVQGNNSAGGLQTLHTAALDGSHAETLIWRQADETRYLSGLDLNGTYLVVQKREWLNRETGTRHQNYRVLAYLGAQQTILHEGIQPIPEAVRLGDLVLFVAGNELWRTDGSVIGTELVRSLPSSPTFNTRGIEINGRIAFSVAGTVWLSDGTEQGTQPISGSIAGSLFRFRDLMIVIARGDTPSIQAIDGDTVTDLGKLGGRFHSMLGVRGDALYLRTNEAVWQTDGTRAGTGLVFDQPVPSRCCLIDATDRYAYGSSEPAQLFQIERGIAEGRLIAADLQKFEILSEHPGSRLPFATGQEYVIYLESSGNNEVWQILYDDGEVPRDLEGETGLEIERLFILDDSRIVIDSNDAFWITDGTRKGTQQILSLSNWNEERKQAQLDPIVYAGRFHELGDKLLFTAAADGIGITTWGTYAVDLPTPSLVGDLQGDGVVDIRDFLALSRNFGRTNALPEDGDLDGDADIDIADFIVLSENFGRTR